MRVQHLESWPREARPCKRGKLLCVTKEILTIARWPLAHLLRNRFYVGEVVYRGKVHSAERVPAAI